MLNRTNCVLLNYIDFLPPYFEPSPSLMKIQKESLLRILLVLSTSFESQNIVQVQL